MQNSEINFNSKGILFQTEVGDLVTINQTGAAQFKLLQEYAAQNVDIKKLWTSDCKVKDSKGRLVNFSEAPFTKAIQSCTEQTASLQFEFPNGNTSWLSLCSYPLFEVGVQDSFFVVTTVTDISFQKRVSSSILERESLLRTFMNRSPGMIWVLDEDATLLYANDFSALFLAFNPTNVYIGNIFEVVPVSVATRLYAKCTAIFETGNQTEWFDKFDCPKGEVIGFFINSFLMKNDFEKKIAGAYAAMFLEKPNAEDQLREENDRLQMWNKASSDAIWEWDLRTGYVCGNEALRTILGHFPEDNRGVSWWVGRIHSEDRKRVSDKLKATLAEHKQSWNDEYRFRVADGTYKHIEDKGYVEYSGASPVRIIGSLKDITIIKELQHQLIQEKLDTQKQISETIIQVQEMERTRIGHELHDNVNQILSTVKMFLDIMTPASQEDVKIKDKVSQYMQTAIDEIRKLSKELVVPQLRNENLLESINSLINDIHMSSSIKVHFSHDEEADFLCSGKKITLFRIIQEQFKNIMKYSQATEVNVSLCHNFEDIELIVRDNGVGFDTNETSTGIGLTNINDRAAFYGGAFSIVSAPDKGCLIKILIPIF